jgi:hypothetical protein
MGKHTDVVTYPRDESPFGDELPLPGFIHRIPRPWAHGGVATMVIESVELVGDDVRATITTGPPERLDQGYGYAAGPGESPSGA